jgi:drug/metabolite transporter (DMT)-like permease
MAIRDYLSKGDLQIDTKGLQLAYAAAVLNAAIIGLSFLFVKIALEHAGPIDTLTYRFAVSFAVMSVPVLFRQVKWSYRGKPIFQALLLATLYPIAFFLLQTVGLNYADSSEGGILFAFTPVLTVFLASLFLKEATTLLQKLSIVLSVLGVVLIFILKGSMGSLDRSSFLGIFLLFLSCVSMAGYNVWARSLLRTFRPAEISYMMLSVGFVAFLAASLIDHGTAGTLDQFMAPLASGSFIASILYLGVLSSLVTSLSANYALSKLEASRLSVFSNLSTVVSIGAGAMFLGEDIKTYHVLGSLLILLGVVGTNVLGRKKRSRTGEM